jgi:hypothetical protein
MRLLSWIRLRKIQGSFGYREARCGSYIFAHSVWGE